MRRPALLPSLLCAVALSCAPRGADLEHALAGHRPFQLRLSFQHRHTPCEPAAAVADSLPRAFAPLECAPPDNAQLQRIMERSARIVEAARSRPDSSAALGRADLLTAGGAAAYERAIRNLAEAARQDSAADVLNDLGVAYAARAAELGDPLDLLRAVESVLRAVERDTTFAPALYNRALLLERLSLTHRAATAWAAFTVAEHGSAWALEQPPRRIAPAQPDLQPLREDSARPALAAWGTAFLAGDSIAARAALDRARRIGSVLRDLSIADAVAEIDAADATHRLRIAEAQTAYERGEADFERGAFVGAGPALERAARAYAGTSSPFRLWTDLARAGLRMYAGEYGQADSIGAHVLANADADRYPAVIGRAKWVRALTEARLGTYERGLAWYAEGMDAFMRAGENENTGAVEFLISQSLLLLGQSRASERRALRGLELLAYYPTSTRLHDGLLSFGRQVSGLGLHATALAIHAEGLSVAALTGRVKDPGEVYVRLAQTAVAAGRMREAEQHLAAARAVYATVSDSIMRQRGEIDIVDTESALVVNERPAEALRLLSDAVSYFTTQRLAPGSIRALTRRSAALRAEGRHQEAATDLERAIAMYERNLDVSNAAARAALRESAAPAYDAMVVAQLAMNRPDSAFGYLMRSHGSTAAAVEAAAQRRGARVLAYALLPDELVTWSYDDGAWSAVRMATPTVVVEQHIAAFTDALRRRDDAGAAEAGRALHALLIPESLDDSPILVVPDRALASLPFAALVDPASGRFLAERALVSMYAAGRASLRRGVRLPSRVLVASGARFDPLTFPDLAPLPGARAEATRVTGLYGTATLVEGEDATPGRLLRELQHHDVLHFAGHARALPATPEQSFLVTASDARGANRITASEIMRLDLGHVSLVVLGVCSAAERGDGRSGEVNGLAQAFLTAGAGAVIASIWEVDDAATAELLTRMHAGVLAGSSAAAALRAAQLELMRSTDARLRSPAAWAGFQHYTS